MKNRLVRLIADMLDRIGALLHPEHIRHAVAGMIFRIRTILFRLSFGVLILGIPWCAGALFHAFDIPVFVSCCGVFLLAASLIAGLFSCGAT